MRRFRVPAFELASLAALLVAFLSASPFIPLVESALVGFLAWALVYLAGVSLHFRTNQPGPLGERSAQYEFGRGAMLGISILIVIAAMMGQVTLISARSGSNIHAIVGAASIVLAWVVLQTSFAVHYAHRYFQNTETGLAFKGGAEPVFSDFFYFAVTIGMTFQTSDVTVVSPAFRRLVLAHASLSFVFSMFILAVSVNAVAIVL